LSRLAPFTAVLLLAPAACLFEPPAALPPVSIGPKDADLPDRDPTDAPIEQEEDSGFDDAGADAGEDSAIDGGEENLPPIALADSATTTMGAAIDLAVLANDSDPEGDALTVLGVDSPANGTAQAVAGGIRYTPAPAFSGTERFGYRIGDSRGGEAAAEITVFVVPELLLLPVSAEINLNSRGAFTASGGVPPYFFRIATGTGQIDADTGAFFSAGVPGSARVVVEDASGQSDSSTVTFGNGDLFYVGGFGNGGDEEEVYRSSDGVTFQTAGSLSTPLYLHGSVVFEDRIFVAGGRNESFEASELVQASPDGAAWSTVGMLPVAMRGCELVVFQERLFLLGGRDSLGQFGNHRNEVWSSGDGSGWVLAGRLPAPRAYGAAFVHQGELWYAGGTNAANVVVDEIWSSPDGSSWTLRGSLPTARLSIGNAIHDGQMWLIGGTANGDDGSIEVLRTTTAQSFTSGGDLPMGIASPEALSWRGDLWVVGGADALFSQNPQEFDTVLTLTPSGEWIAAGALPAGRYYGSMVIFSP
jgi:hypothetical protein